MMTAYLTSEFADDLEEALLQKVLATCVQKITKEHYDAELGII